MNRLGLVILLPNLIIIYGSLVDLLPSNAYGEFPVCDSFWCSLSKVLFNSDSKYVKIIISGVTSNSTISLFNTVNDMSLDYGRASVES